MPYHCSYGLCNSDGRYGSKGKRPRPEMVGVTWHKFPSKKKDLTRLVKWIEACGREDLTVGGWTDRRARWMAVCSKHFIGGHGPTPEHPDPIPARWDADDYVRHRPKTRKRPRQPPEGLVGASKAGSSKTRAKVPATTTTTTYLRRSPRGLATLRTTPSYAKTSSESEDDYVPANSEEESSCDKPSVTPVRLFKSAVTVDTERGNPDEAIARDPNLLILQNKRYETENARLREENAKIAEKIQQCKEAIAKFVTVRNELKKMGIGIPAPKAEPEMPVTFVPGEHFALGEIIIKPEPQSEESSEKESELEEECNRNRRTKPDHTYYKPDPVYGTDSDSSGRTEESSVAQAEPNVNHVLVKTEAGTSEESFVVKTEPNGDQVLVNAEAGTPEESFIVKTEPNGSQVLFNAELAEDQFVIKIEPTEDESAFGEYFRWHEMPDHETSDHEMSGHEISGHEISGHEISGHGMLEHRMLGHEISGHGISGHEMSGHGMLGHGNVYSGTQTVFEMDLGGDHIRVKTEPDDGD